MGDMDSTGRASIEIAAPVEAVFAAVADVSRMGEWSPECTGGEWLDGAEAGLGARFAGHNQVAFHKWDTISEVTEFVPNEVFEFCAEAHTTWRYEFEATPDGTRVTESFRAPPVGGLRGLIYDKILRREKAMKKGLVTTLLALKASLEA